MVATELEKRLAKIKSLATEALDTKDEGGYSLRECKGTVKAIKNVKQLLLSLEAISDLSKRFEIR